MMPIIDEDDDGIRPSAEYVPLPSSEEGEGEDDDVERTVLELRDKVLELDLALSSERATTRSLRATVEHLHQLLQSVAMAADADADADASASDSASGWSTRDAERPNGGGGGGGGACGAREAPILEAASRGDIMTMSLLLSSASKPLSGGGGVGARTLGDALIRAAERGHLEMARYLVGELGADVHAGHDSALLWACRNGDLALFDYLLRSGADVEALGRCAVALAARGGHFDVVDRLLAATSTKNAARR